MNEEYRNILHTGEAVDLLDENERLRIRSLWEQYCQRQDLQVDTFQYDAEITALWLVFEDRLPGWTKDDFENFMLENLV